MGGKSGGGPSPPDPVATAQAQYGWNRQAALDSARLNQINQLTPWAGTYWTGEVGSPDRTQHTVYNPALNQAIFGSLVPQMLASYASPLDFSGFQSITPMGGEAWGGEAPPIMPIATGYPSFGAGGGFGGGKGGGKGGRRPHPWDMMSRRGARTADWRDANRNGVDDRDEGGGFDEAGWDADYGFGAGFDHLGAGGLLDAIDNATGGALSAGFNAGVDEFGGLSAQEGWGYDPGDVGGTDTGGFGGMSDAETGGYGGYDPSGDYGGFDDGDTGGDDDGGFDGGLGYQLGGFTGFGSDNRLQPQRIAGRVHEGEFVVPADEPAIQGLAAALMGRDEDLQAMMRDRRRAAGRSPMASMPAAGDLAALLAGGR